MASSLPATEVYSRGDRAPGELSWRVRLALLFVVALLVGVFVLASVLKPYGEDGQLRQDSEGRLLGTHQAPPLNLPECSFRTLTGKPCPSCGMTTSFALLMYGDVANSFRANFVGTLLAVVMFLSIPWALTCIVRKRLLLVASLERTLTWAVAAFMVLLLVRWVFVFI